MAPPGDPLLAGSASKLQRQPAAGKSNGVCAPFQQQIRCLTSLYQLNICSSSTPFPACRRGINNPIDLDAHTLAALLQEGVDMNCLRRIDRTSFCEWKGSAIYYDVVVTPTPLPTPLPRPITCQTHRQSICKLCQVPLVPIFPAFPPGTCRFGVARNTSSKRMRTNTAGRPSAQPVRGSVQTPSADAEGRMTTC